MTVVPTSNAAPNRAGSAAIMLIGATAAFGFGNVAHKSVLSHLDLWTVLVLRGLVVVVCLLPFALAEWKALGASRKDFLSRALQPALGFTAGVVFQSFGALYTSATSLGFLINLSAIFTPLICIALKRCCVSLSIVLACALSFAGTMLMGNGMPGSLGVGEWCCIGAALGYSWWMVSLQRVSATHQCPCLISLLQWLPAIAIGYGLSPAHRLELLALPQVVWMELAFLCVVASAAAYVVAATAQARISPVAAAIIYSAEAVFGMIAASVWLGESLSVAGYLGALCILSGILVVSMPVRTQQKA
jgi:drug/metabolite transporter (DMT)-like permease